MSTLVKGMGMPTEGTVMAIYKLNGKFYASLHGTDLCPIIEVPPHGRLIDADALGSFPYNMDFCDGGEADEWIQNAPTIIEAEE